MDCFGQWRRLRLWQRGVDLMDPCLNFGIECINGVAELRLLGEEAFRFLDEIRVHRRTLRGAKESG
jgi:hypothetical protein